MDEEPIECGSIRGRMGDRPGDSTGDRLKTPPLRSTRGGDVIRRRFEWRPPPSGEERTGILEQPLHGVEEPRPFRTVDDSVVAGEAEGEGRAGEDHAVLRHDLLEGAAGGQNRDLRIVDDRCREATTVAAHVGDREGATGELLSRDAPGSASFGHRPNRIGELHE